MKPDSVDKDCPSFAELSAWVDGEGLPELDVHLAVCARCQELAAVCHELDQAVRHLATPPAGLAGRIKLRCRQLPQADREPVLWLFPALRLAAGLAALATLAGVLAFSLGRQAAGPQVVSAAPVSPTASRPVPVSEPAIEPELPSGEAYVATEDGAPAGATVRTGEMALAATRHPAAGGVRFGGVHPSNRGEGVPGRVVHVWVVRDLAASRRDFLDGLPAGVRCMESVGGEGEMLSLRAVLPDSQAQSLVDRLASRGYSLVSPVGPQPGQAQEHVFTNRPMLYEARFVPAR
jgi:hypothetical protein